MGKTNKTKGLFNKDGEPIIDHDREMQEKIDRVNKKLADHEKNKKEAKALYEKAIALLKEAADKDNDLAALFYSIHLMSGQTLHEINSPWETKCAFSDAMKYITYATEMPSDAFEIANVIKTYFLQKHGYIKSAIPNYGQPMSHYKDPRVTEAYVEYLNEADRLSKDPTLTPQERASRITQAYNKYQQTARQFGGIGDTINQPIFMTTGSPSMCMP